MTKSFTVALAAIILSACATMTDNDSKARAELAPHGKLRAGMNLQNTLFTKRNSAGELEGVSVDVMNELGRRLGVPVEMVMFQSPGDVADQAGQDKWDVAILAIEPTRAKTISFSPAMTEIEASYLVPPGSKFTAVSQVDSPGTKIAVSEKAGYDLYLTKALKNASLVRVRGDPFNTFASQHLDAMAGLKPQLIPHLQQMPGAHVLDGGFMTVNHGLGATLGHAAADAYLTRFAEDLVRSGFLKESIARHQVKGIAPVKM